MSDQFGTLCIKGLRIFGIKRELLYKLTKTLKGHHFIGHSGTSLKLILICQCSILSSNSLSKNMLKNTAFGPKQKSFFFRFCLIYKDFLKSVVSKLFPKYSQSYANLNVKSSPTFTGSEKIGRLF